jgi:hypothetical protein
VKNLFVHYFVAFKFNVNADGVIHNKVVKVRLNPTDKQQQYNDVVKEVAEKSILMDYYNEHSFVPYEQFYRRNTTIICLTEL